MPTPQKLLKVLYLITANTYGGAEHAVYKLVKTHDRSKYFPLVACLGNDEVFIRRIQECGVNIFPLNMPYMFGIPAFIKLYNLLKREKVDIVHTQLFRADVFGRIAGKLAGAKIIVSTIQNMEAFRKYAVLNMLDRYTSLLTDKIISVSDIVRDFTIEKTALDISRFTTIYNFVDLEDYPAEPLPQESRIKARKDLGIGNAELVIGTIGRLAPQKAQNHFIEAAKIILSKFPQARFLIAGDGPLKNDLLKLAEDLGIRERVVFTGFVENVRSIFEALDIFVLSSLWEGLPLTACEAMACHVPVVATTVGGVPELIEDEKTGLLVEPGNPALLAEKICSIIEDDELGNRLAADARKAVENRFSLDCVRDQIENLYTNIAEAKSIL